MSTGQKTDNAWLVIGSDDVGPYITHCEANAEHYRTVGLAVVPISQAAAAPELLEALESVAAALSLHSHWKPTMVDALTETVVAAIAKAKA
jgi:hypothetical protein